MTDAAIPTPAQIRRLPVTDVRRFCKALRKAGLLVDHGGAHLRVTLPGGRFLTTVPYTPSDRRALLNGRSHLARRIAEIADQRAGGNSQPTQLPT